MMLKTLISIFLISLICSTGYCEQLAEFTDDSLPVLNENLRRIQDGTDIEPGAIGSSQLASTAVTAGSYTYSSITVDTDGRLTSASSGTSKIIQVVNVMDGAVATGTTAMPADDTIPQITEGDEYMTLAITPTSATSKLKIDVVWIGHNTNTAYFSVALFQDATAGALRSAIVYMEATARLAVISFSHYMVAGTTSETTFRVRAGGVTGATTTSNGAQAGRLHGGVLASSMTITEIAA